MKVKNIAFSGFAAVILAGVCGVADAASINLASKSYVDTALQGKASVDDFENLESTVNKKATQEALKEVLDQVIINTNDIADLKAGGYITDDDLAEVQRTLQAAIDEKQAKGEYAAASELESLKTTVETLQKGEVSKETVDNLQASVDAIVADYAKKSELTSAEERLQAAINAIKIPDLSVYAKTADLAAVATSGSYNDLTDKPTLITQDDLTALRTALETEIAKKQNSGDYATAEALQTISTELGTLKGDVYTKAEVEARIAEAATGGEIDLDGYATVAALNNAVASLQDKDTELSNGLSALTASLAGYVKSGSLAAVATSGLYSDLQGKPEIPSIAGLATEQALTDLQTALEAEIAKKQAAGEYLVAADLNVLNNQVAALQSDKADVATVAEIQTTISKLGDTYATDAEVSAAIDAVKALIPTMPTKVSELSNDVGYITDSALSGYAKTADVELVDNKLVSATAEEIDAMSSEDKARKYPSIAVSQTIANAAVTKVNQVAGDLSTLQTQVSTNTADIKEIQDAGYQTADDVKVALQAAKDYADANDADTVYDDTAVRGLISGNAENIAKNAAAIATNTGDIANIKAANYQNADQVQGAITKATADMVTDSELAAKGFVAGIKTSGSYLVNFDADGNVSYAAVQIIGKDSQPIDLTEGEIK